MVDATPVLTSSQQDQWDGAQHEADQLSLDTELEEKVTVIILEAKHWQQEWSEERGATAGHRRDTPADARGGIGHGQGGTSGGAGR